MAETSRDSSSKSKEIVGFSSVDGETAVVDCGRRKSSCGYCQSSGRTSVSHGLWAHSVTVADYQDLLDRGWGRSGCFLYKPEMDTTCCPSYTIRLKANDFIPSKDQIRARRRMQRFLDDEIEPCKGSEANCSCSCHQASQSDADADEEKMLAYLSAQVNNAVHCNMNTGTLPNNVPLPNASVKKVAQSKRRLLIEGEEKLTYSCNVAFQVSSAMKASHLNASPQSIADLLAKSLNPFKEEPSLSIRACNGHLNFYANPNTIRASHKVCKRKECCVDKAIEKHEGKKRKLEIHLKKSSFDPDEYALYRRYLMKVHNETPNQVSESSYKRFLVDSPLIYVPPSGNKYVEVPPCGFGSFHQQYIIDGKLVAVGVIDILPKCLSSYYFFWDPDFPFLSLGKYSSLQEIDWVNEHHALCSSLEYYYLGYYIHSCAKMRYKASYRPSELLCPLRYEWVRFDTAKPFLDTSKYVVLSDIAKELTPSDRSETSFITREGDQDDEEMNDANFVHSAEASSDDSLSDESDSDTDSEYVGDIVLGINALISI